MLLAFELSGEHETLPAGEILACMRSLDIEHTVVKSEGQCLILKIGDETPAISTLPALLSARLAMTHHIIAVIFECRLSESSILGSVIDAEIAISRGETFSVRARKIQQSPITTERMERLIGEVIFERNRVNGARVNLTSPDHRFRAILTDDSCIFGEVLASTERREFEERKPHKKAFFYPGAISPKVARAIVNLCEIRTGNRVLDPFCGTGGILVEAGMIGASVIGIDVQESMVRGARMNLGAHGFEYQLICGDACNLPLRDQSIDVVVTDPPYGRSAVVMAESIVSLYRYALFEMHRVIVDGGHAVVVSDFELPWTDEIGFTTIELHTQRVHRSLTRYILVLEK